MKLRNLSCQLILGHYSQFIRQIALFLFQQVGNKIPLRRTKIPIGGKKVPTG